MTCVLRHQNSMIALLVWGLILNKRSFYSAAVVLHDTLHFLCVEMLTTVAARSKQEHVLFMLNAMPRSAN